MNQLHPIQLLDIVVTELSVTVADPKAAQEYEGEIDLALEVGTSAFEEGEEQIAVGIRARVSPKKSESADAPIFVVEVDLSGQFKVNFDEFKFADLDEWSKVNAPFLLIPYVREQVYGIAVRAGIKGLVFPLFVQPRKLPQKT